MAKKEVKHLSGLIFLGVLIAIPMLINMTAGKEEQFVLKSPVKSVKEGINLLKTELPAVWEGLDFRMVEVDMFYTRAKKWEITSITFFFSKKSSGLIKILEFDNPHLICKRISSGGDRIPPAFKDLIRPIEGKYLKIDIFDAMKKAGSQVDEEFKQHIRPGKLQAELTLNTDMGPRGSPRSFVNVWTVVFSKIEDVEMIQANTDDTGEGEVTIQPNATFEVAIDALTGDILLTQDLLDEVDLEKLR